MKNQPNLPAGEPVDDSCQSTPEEWMAFENEFNEVRKQIYQKMKGLSEEQQDAIYKRLWAKQKESFASVPDPGKYLAYHKALCGGTDQIYSPKLDFKGEHSLLAYYKKVLNEI